MKFIWTKQLLEAKTPEERYTIWLNARRLDSAEAKATVALIETCGLPYAEAGGMSMSDPRALEMREIIESAAGEKACLEATSRGEAALAGVEPLIRAAMKDRHGAFSQMTITAGSIVGELMLSKGFKIAGRRKMPDGSVAQTAAFWKLP